MEEKRTCRSCDGPLSRYNADTVCGLCARRGGTTPPAPAWLWDSEPLRDALADVDLGRVLAHIRAAAGLSQLELATLLGWSQSGVARVESGQRDTLYDIRRLLEMADNLDMPRTALLPILVGLPEKRDAELEANGKVSLNRRDLGGILIGLTACASLGPVQIPQRINFAHIRYLENSIEHLRTQDQHVGGGPLLTDGVRLYRRARRMLDESDYSESIAQQLIGAVGQLAICVGWLRYDTTDYRGARAMYLEARYIGDQAGDDSIAVHALTTMSLDLVRASRTNGNPASAREALRLVRRADELTETGRFPQLHSLLAARAATAHAVIGDRSSFERAITHAWRELDREPNPDTPSWLRFVNRSEIGVHEAKGRAYLGQHTAAAGLYQASLDAPLLPRNRASYRALLASALASAGDIDQAVCEATTVLATLSNGGILSPRTFETLRNVRTVAAARHRDRDFCELYDHVTVGSNS